MDSKKKSLTNHEILKWVWVVNLNNSHVKICGRYDVADTRTHTLSVRAVVIFLFFFFRLYFTDIGAQIHNVLRFLNRSFCVLFRFSAFRSLGLSKMKTLPGHHRKRLAVESSRHHSRPDDSNMFVIKLPPNPYYYANTNTGHSKNAIDDKNQKVCILFVCVSVCLPLIPLAAVTRRGGKNRSSMKWCAVSWHTYLVCMPLVSTFIMIQLFEIQTYRSKRPCATCIPLFHYPISVVVYSFSLCVRRAFASFRPVNVFNWCKYFNHYSIQLYF